MPFVSKSQVRKFYALKNEGKISQATIDRWKKHTKTPIENLPEKVGDDIKKTGQLAGYIRGQVRDLSDKKSGQKGFAISFEKKIFGCDNGSTESGGIDRLKKNIKIEKAVVEKAEALPLELEGQFPQDPYQTVSKYANLSLKKEHKDPRGGLTPAGRRAYNEATGANLKPGVKGPPDTPEKMKRKGSWALRFYGRKKLPPLKKPNGEPTRFALTAKAWGEPIPKTEKDARAIAAKGRELLKKYREVKK